MLNEVLAINGLQHHHFILLQFMVLRLRCRCPGTLEPRETFGPILLGWFRELLFGSHRNHK